MKRKYANNLRNYASKLKKKSSSNILLSSHQFALIKIPYLYYIGFRATLFLEQFLIRASALNSIYSNQFKIKRANEPLNDEWVYGDF